MKATALLYTVDGTWTLEPLLSLIGVARQFPTAAAARSWAKDQRLTVRRAPNCDSIEYKRVPAPYRIGPTGKGWMEAPMPSTLAGHVSVLITATGARGQDLWSERRDVTLEQADALI
jgi:hypothetical protein